MYFDRTPPVDAFWSLTMDDATNYLLVAHPIDRYSIGDRTAGVRHNDDGSLDLSLQHDSPGAGREANWLPAPDGPFRPMLRLYAPHEEAFDDVRWRLPPFERVD